MNLRMPFLTDLKNCVTLDPIVLLLTTSRGKRQVESFCRTLLSMLPTLLESYKLHWHQYLNKVVNAYNCTRHDTTGFSPFYLLFERHSHLPIHLLFNVAIPFPASIDADYVKQWKTAVGETYNITKM